MTGRLQRYDLSISSLFFTFYMHTISSRVAEVTHRTIFEDYHSSLDIYNSVLFPVISKSVKEYEFLMLVLGLPSATRPRDRLFILQCHLSYQM